MQNALSTTSSDGGSEARGARVIPLVPQALESKPRRSFSLIWAEKDSAAAGGLLQQPAGGAGPSRACVLADSVGSLTLAGSDTDEGPSSPYA